MIWIYLAIALAVGIAVGCALSHRYVADATRHLEECIEALKESKK
jgi:uncharacterized membrane-anchored protein YhcB (DUF1043 family)